VRALADGARAGTQPAGVRGLFSARRGGRTRAAPGRSATPAMAGMHAPLARLARPAPGSFPVADDACGLPASECDLSPRGHPRCTACGARPPADGWAVGCRRGPSVPLRDGAFLTTIASLARAFHAATTRAPLPLHLEPRVFAGLFDASSRAGQRVAQTTGETARPGASE